MAVFGVGSNKSVWRAAIIPHDNTSLTLHKYCAMTLVSDIRVSSLINFIIKPAEDGRQKLFQGNIGQQKK